MRYLVDLEKKEIVYDEEMPAGHMIALKKIFEEKGFKFFNAPRIETMDEFHKRMKDEFGKHAVWGAGGITGPVGSAGTPGPTGFNISDMKRYQEAKLRQREHEERDKWMQQMIGEQRPKYYSPDGKEHGSKEEMESWMKTMSYKHSLGYTPTPSEEKQLKRERSKHPADKSNAELRYEASKIQEELEDVQKTSRLKESLEKLKSKLGFL